MLELLRSLDLQPTLEQVDQGTSLDFAQYSLLRESADAKLYHLMRKVTDNPGLDPAAKQQCEQDLRTLQDACLGLAPAANQLSGLAPPATGLPGPASGPRGAGEPSGLHAGLPASVAEQFRPLGMT